MEGWDGFLPTLLPSAPGCSQSLPAWLPQSLQGSNPRGGLCQGAQLEMHISPEPSLHELGIHRVQALL